MPTPASGPQPVAFASARRRGTVEAPGSQPLESRRKPTTPLDSADSPITQQFGAALKRLALKLRNLGG